MPQTTPDIPNHQTSSKLAARMAKAVAGVYIALVLALIAGAVAIWRLRCEGFGCMGIGVAWFAWVVSFFIVLGVGLFARSKADSVPGLARAGKVAWWLQLALGAVVVAIWLFRRAT